MQALEADDMGGHPAHAPAKSRSCIGSSGLREQSKVLDKFTISAEELIQVYSAVHTLLTPRIYAHARSLGFCLLAKLKHAGKTSQADPVH